MHRLGHSLDRDANRVGWRELTRLVSIPLSCVRDPSDRSLVQSPGCRLCSSTRDPFLHRSWSRCATHRERRTVGHRSEGQDGALMNEKMHQSR